VYSRTKRSMASWRDCSRRSARRRQAIATLESRMSITVNTPRTQQHGSDVAPPPPHRIAPLKISRRAARTERSDAAVPAAARVRRRLVTDDDARTVRFTAALESARTTSRPKLSPPRAEQQHFSHSTASQCLTFAVPRDKVHRHSRDRRQASICNESAQLMSSASHRRST
jgi:hypothetical protein